MRTFIAALFLCLFTFSLHAGEWPPAAPSELAATAPTVEKDAHAEAIIWDIRVADEVTSNYPHTIQDHYLKIKIFDQRGVEMLAKVDIPYARGATVSNIAARTTKRNGEVIEMKQDAVFDRVLVKGNGIRWQAKSFALPGLEPGAVVEYGWKERHEEAVANYVPLDLQREIPVETVMVHLKPLVHPYFPFTMRTMVFHAPDAKFEPERNGFYVATWSRMPAFEEEPDMPAERNIRSWMLVYYEEKVNVPPEKYWKDQGRRLYGTTKSEMKVDGEVRAVADELAASGTGEQKLQRLYQYCRTHVRNLNGPRNGLTPEQRTKFKENKSPQDTLRQGVGTSRDIDMLFAALATAAGFDARLARTNDRSYGTMGAYATTMYFLPAQSIAVNVDGKWRFFDPGVSTLPFGMLRWQEESAFALISDPKDPQTTVTPPSFAKDSLRKRTAKLALSADGTLEGDIRIELTGHPAVAERNRYEDETDEQIGEETRKEVQGQFGEAEVSNFHMENLADTEKPLITSFHVKVAAYAQRTGKRLFFEPSLFEKNRPARFTATARRYPVQFAYPWSENDTVSIQLPAGFDLDHADMPTPLELAHVGHYRAKAMWTKSTRTLDYTRDFTFGEEGGVMVKQENYNALKSIFDAVHEKDGHMITAKETVTAAITH